MKNEAMPPRSSQSLMVPGILAILVLAVLGFVLMGALSPKTSQQLQTKTEVKPQEFSDSFFADAQTSEEKTVGGLTVKSGIKTVEASAVQEAGTLLGVRISGELPESSIPVVWSQVSGVWKAETLTPIDPNAPILFGVFGLPSEVAQVSGLELRMESSGFTDDAPKGELLWDMNSLLKKGAR